MNISIVIPSFNGLEILKRSFPKVLEILEKEKIDKKELIVVDDKSTDGSYEFLQKFKKEFDGNSEIEIVQNTENKGFSSTVNKGFSLAHGDIVVLLNTDVIPRPDFLSFVLPHFKDEKVFAVGCMDESVIIF